MPDASIQHLEALLGSRPEHVLEFGAGGSTLLLSEWAGDVVSIEHSQEWTNRIEARLRARSRRNVTVVHAPPDDARRDWMYRGRDGRFYRAYVRAGTAAVRRRFGGLVDLVLVDGRARVACVKALMRYVRPGGVLVLDDASRAEYRLAQDDLAQHGWTCVRMGSKRHKTDFWTRPGNGDGGATSATADVLVLSSDGVKARVNDAIHRGFFDAAPGRVAYYGPGEGEAVPFDAARPLRDVVRVVEPRIIVVNMKKRVDPWIETEQLRELDRPLAVVEVDYCFSSASATFCPKHQGSDGWYERAGVDHLFLRHKSDFERSSFRSRSWLPFSIDPMVMHPGKNDAVAIGFAGTISPKWNYFKRRRVLSAVKDLVWSEIRALTGSMYADFLRSCVLGVTCSGLFRYDNAKHLEIPACGALLLTDGTDGTDALLPDPEMYERYELDANVRGLVLRLLAEPDTCRRRARLAADHVRRHHSHAVRWKELYDTCRDGGLL